MVVVVGKERKKERKKSYEKSRDKGLVAKAGKGGDGSEGERS